MNYGNQIVYKIECGSTQKTYINSTSLNLDEELQLNEILFELYASNPVKIYDPSMDVFLHRNYRIEELEVVRPEYLCDKLRYYNDKYTNINNQRIEVVKKLFSIHAVNMISNGINKTCTPMDTICDKFNSYNQSGYTHINPYIMSTKINELITGGFKGVSLLKTNTIQCVKMDFIMILENECNSSNISS